MPAGAYRRRCAARSAISVQHSVEPPAHSRITRGRDKQSVHARTSPCPPPWQETVDFLPYTYAYSYPYSIGARFPPETPCTSTGRSTGTGRHSRFPTVSQGGGTPADSPPPCETVDFLPYTYAYSYPYSIDARFPPETPCTSTGRSTGTGRHSRFPTVSCQGGGSLKARHPGESRDPGGAAVAYGLDPGFRRGDKVGWRSNRRAKPQGGDRGGRASFACSLRSAAPPAYRRIIRMRNDQCDRSRAARTILCLSLRPCLCLRAKRVSALAFILDFATCSRGAES
jgi:hypothetical protein